MRKNQILIVVFAAFAVGVHAADQGRNIDERYAELEHRIQVLERQVHGLEGKQQAEVQWVLWKDEKPIEVIFGLSSAPPQALSSYGSKNECFIAATRLVEPGGKTISTDPVKIRYAKTVVTFTCLPPSVQVGVNRR